MWCAVLMRFLRSYEGEAGRMQGEGCSPVRSNCCTAISHCCWLLKQWNHWVHDPGSGPVPHSNVNWSAAVAAETAFSSTSLFSVDTQARMWFHCYRIVYFDVLFYYPIVYNINSVKYGYITSHADCMSRTALTFTCQKPMQVINRHSYLTITFTENYLMYDRNIFDIFENKLVDIFFLILIKTSQQLILKFLKISTYEIFVTWKCDSWFTQYFSVKIWRAWNYIENNIFTVNDR